MIHRRCRRAFLTFTLLALVVLTASVMPPLIASQSTVDRNTRQAAFLEEMTGKHGFDPASLRRAFDDAKFRPRIVELMDRAAKPKPWSEYRAIFVNTQKLEAGRRFWSDNREVLELARDRYGVPEEVITAIIGVETHYGRNKGKFNVLEALKTLAFDYPRREELFRMELEHFLLLSREEKLALSTPVGSYAGAMGIAQFMPGSYRRYAIDFDGDGKRDLFSNDADAIGSVANYFAAHGWQRGQPVAAPATVSPNGQTPFQDAKLSTRYSLDELKQRGVTLAGAFAGEQEAMPVTLKNTDDHEYWLGFDNFYVITRYNRSAYYAMAVYQLSQELRRHYDATLADDHQ